MQAAAQWGEENLHSWLRQLLTHMSERFYHSDSFLRTLTGAVTDLRKFAGGNGELARQLAPDRTAFYPTSGGQPFDTGQDGTTAQSFTR